MDEAIVLYSGSVLDIATTLCFFLFQEIKLPPMETQYPDVDFLSEKTLHNQHLNNKPLLYGYWNHITTLFQQILLGTLISE